MRNEKLYRVICDEMELDYDFCKENYKCRQRELVFSRHLFFYIKKMRTREGLTAIGRFFEKDEKVQVHANVLHGVKNIQNLIDIKDPVVKVLKNVMKSASLLDENDEVIPVYKAYIPINVIVEIPFELRKKFISESLVEL